MYFAFSTFREYILAKAALTSFPLPRLSAFHLLLLLLLPLILVLLVPDPGLPLDWEGESRLMTVTIVNYGTDIPSSPHAWRVELS